ncbi:tetratricopeptide repeat protein [Paludibacter sp. 221]|uniref:tetratricopeptide repeat protein n=1 Tax=Paludibacter sp. 221 TaxID=2302939 RepID=UPI0013D62487|nr:tetratricopeptide repeat protein [Paludibacter sp. 221]NDV46673.1 tetratricopeptide repeat protein [Paludibacter sp. 221]
MKKLILSLLLIASVTSTYAQKSNVSKAKNKALMEAAKPDEALANIREAREYIKPALVDETTKDLANTWYIAGLIGYKENEAYNSKILLKENVSEDDKGKAVMDSYRYFVIADSLDQLPNAKGKVRPRHRKDIKSMVKEYYTYNLINYGAYLFDKRDYKNALDVFEVFLAIPDLPLSENEIEKDSTYNMIEYYAAISASNAGMSDKAINLYTRLKDKDYEPVAVYQLLYEEYKKENDTINFVKTLEEGAQKFPTEPWFIQNLINHYIYSGQAQVALDYLNTAIERDPTSAQYYFVKGGLLESTGSIDEAFEAYEKAIELDSTMANAYAEIGRLHYNKAIKILDDADLIRDAKKRRAENAKADEEFKAAIPFYSKASSMEPAEKNYKVMLRNIYYRLKMDKEYEAIDKEINAM